MIRSVIRRRLFSCLNREEGGGAVKPARYSLFPMHVRTAVWPSITSFGLRAEAKMGLRKQPTPGLS